MTQRGLALRWADSHGQDDHLAVLGGMKKRNLKKLCDLLGKRASKPATGHGFLQYKLHQNLTSKKPMDERNRSSNEQIEVARPGFCEHCLGICITHHGTENMDGHHNGVFIRERSTAGTNHGMLYKDYGSGARKCGISLLYYFTTTMGVW